MIAFFAAMTVLDALVLWFVITVPGHWVSRAVSVVLALTVNMTLLFAVLPQGDGKATTKSIPEPNQFLACAVDEPRAIYFWVLVDGGPRGYRQPYSTELHKTCQAARKAAQQGMQVGLKRGRSGRGNQHPVPGRFVPYVLPPSLPPKS